MTSRRICRSRTPPRSCHSEACEAGRGIPTIHKCSRAYAPSQHRDHQPEDPNDHQTEDEQDRGETTLARPIGRGEGRRHHGRRRGERRRSRRGDRIQVELRRQSRIDRGRDARRRRRRRLDNRQPARLTRLKDDERRVNPRHVSRHAGVGDLNPQPGRRPTQRRRRLPGDEHAHQIARNVGTQTHVDQLRDEDRRARGRAGDRRRDRRLDQRVLRRHRLESGRRGRSEEKGDYRRREG